MRTPCQVAVLSLALSITVFGQKNWADKAEYDLYSSILSKTDPAQQIALIYEWQARYPQTEFARERLQQLAYANKMAGKPEEAFAVALQLLNLDGRDPDTLMIIVKLGPSLPNPTQEYIATITDAANKLLMPRPEVTVLGVVVNPDETPKRVVPASVQTGLPPTLPAATNLSPEAESQRVDDLIKDMRRNAGRAPAPPDPVIAQRAAAQAALDWVKSLNR
jgi:hypothetical protein